MYHGRARVREARRAAHEGQGYTLRHHCGGLAADSPSEDQFTLASVAVELEMNLRSAFDDAADEPAADTDAQPAAGGAGAGAP